MDIEHSVISALILVCPACESQINHIQDGEFSCPSGADSSDVLYRATIIGNQPDTCDELVTIITNWVQSSQASLSVQSSRLQVAHNCIVEIESFGSKLDCLIPTTEVGGVLTEASSGSFTVIGAAAGVAGGILLISVLVIIIAVFVIVKKKKKKRLGLFANHFSL